MIKYLRVILFLAMSLNLNAQDTTEVFDMSQYGDASDSKSYCTQKVNNQAPSKQFSLGYEMNLGFSNSNVNGTEKINSMGGIRATANVLALSTNKLILSIGANYWGSKIRTSNASSNVNVNQVYANRMDIVGLNAVLFKPLNEKHFIIAQANTDLSHIGITNNLGASSSALTYYGSAIFGWKKNDYRMLGFGVSRTYRLGRPIIVPIVLYNKTFNDHWGLETLLPARAHIRYNFSSNSLLMAGYELEGQQFDLQSNNLFLQRGEIKPRLVFEKKLIGFFWMSAQVGYRINGRFNFVNRYDGQDGNEVFVNNWGGSPYFNLSINLVTP